MNYPISELHFASYGYTFLNTFLGSRAFLGTFLRLPLSHDNALRYFAVITKL